MPRRVDKSRIPDELDLARDLIENGELDEAQAIVDGVLLLDAPDEDRIDAYFLRGEICLARGEPGMALLAYDAAATGAPEDDAILAGKGEARFLLWQFDAARAALETALRADPKSARAHRFLALALDRLGKRKVAELHFERAHKLDPEEWPLPVRMARAEFDAVARAAIESLPEAVKAKLGPIGFLVEDYPLLAMIADDPADADPCTLGVFFGEELPARYEATGLAFVPNHIHLFQRCLESYEEVRSRDDLEEEIRTTVYHEVGHYLGYDEEGLEALGLD